MLFSLADQSVTLPPDLTRQPFKCVTFSGVTGCCSQISKHMLSIPCNRQRLYKTSHLEERMIYIDLTEIVRNAVNMLNIELTSVWELNTLIHLRKNYLL